MNAELLLLDGNAALADVDLDAAGFLALLVELIANNSNDDSQTGEFTATGPMTMERASHIATGTKHETNPAVSRYGTVLALANSAVPTSGSKSCRATSATPTPSRPRSPAWTRSSTPLRSST